MESSIIDIVKLVSIVIVFQMHASFHICNNLDSTMLPDQVSFHWIGTLLQHLQRDGVLTHTFHVPQGECTITLQDVSIILGLPIDGVAVSDSTCLDWRKVCATLLRVVLEDRDISGQRLRLSQLT